MPTVPTQTLEQVFAGLVSKLPPEFPIENPDTFSTFYTYLRLAAQVGVDVRALIAELVPNGFPLLAKGVWLDEHARSLGLRRKPSEFTELDCNFVASLAGVMPVPTVFQTAPDVYGTRLEFMAAAGPYAPGQPVLLRARSPGSAHNLANGVRLYPVEVLPGLDYASVNLVAAPGVDAETDAALQYRTLLRWMSISYGSTRYAYESWALEVPGISKVGVDDEHPRGEGSIDVIIAPPAGIPTLAQIAAAQAIVDERKPLTANALVKGPTLVPVAISAGIYRGAGSPEAAVWSARISAFIEALGIGQTLYPSRLADYLHQFDYAADGTRVTNHLLGVQITPSAPVQPAGDELITAGSINVVLN